MFDNRLLPVLVNPWTCLPALLAPSAADSSPLKPGMPSEGSGSLAAAPGSGAPHQQRKPISWTKGELVGQGAFGSVFVAMDNDTGELIAVKQVSMQECWRKPWGFNTLALAPDSCQPDLQH